MDELVFLLVANTKLHAEQIEHTLRTHRISNRVKVLDSLDQVSELLGPNPSAYSDGCLVLYAGQPRCDEDTLNDYRARLAPAIIIDLTREDSQPLEYRLDVPALHQVIQNFTTMSFMLTRGPR